MSTEEATTKPDGVASVSTAGLGSEQTTRAYPACKGINCGCTDGRSHSAACQQEHEDAITGVVGRCSVPMWMNGLPSGSCGKTAYGRRPDESTFWNHAAGEEQRLDGRYAGYVPDLACPAHGGPTMPNVQAQGRAAASSRRVPWSAVLGLAAVGREQAPQPP